jgi:hypothetical protein
MMSEDTDADTDSDTGTGIDAGKSKKTRQDKTRQDKTRQDRTVQDKTSQDDKNKPRQRNTMTGEGNDAGKSRTVGTRHGCTFLSSISQIFL